jgi:hypothetical protein
MVYVLIDEKKKKGKELIQFLKGIDAEKEYINFADDSEKLYNVGLFIKFIIV